VLVKICGATSVADIAVLAEAGVDLIGLWHGVRGGHAELSATALGSLAAAARAAGPEPVLVTLASGVPAVRAAAELSGVRRVQLHGYQQPGMVRALTTACPDLDVIKVLHVRGGECVERGLIAAYERAGVGMFLVDTLGADGRIGSTAVRIDESAAAEILGVTTVPVLLAGGLTADNVDMFRPLLAHQRLAGIDVDTGARDRAGRIDPVKVAALNRAWTVQEEMS
jgi:phosphoribosylanthranilate isomerase